jgi:hypothetical protein
MRMSGCSCTVDLGTLYFDTRMQIRLSPKLFWQPPGRSSSVQFALNLAQVVQIEPGISNALP